MKRRLEADTRTTITIPKRGSKDQHVIITGTPEGVSSVRTRIELLLHDAESTARPTHFLCLPIHSVMLTHGLGGFHRQVLQLNPAIDVNSLVPADQLHLTIGVLYPLTP